MNIETVELNTQVCINCKKRDASPRYLECDICRDHAAALRENNRRSIILARRDANMFRGALAKTNDPEPIGSILDRLLQL